MEIAAPALGVNLQNSWSNFHCLEGCCLWDSRFFFFFPPWDRGAQTVWLLFFCPHSFIHCHSFIYSFKFIPLCSQWQVTVSLGLALAEMGMGTLYICILGLSVVVPLGSTHLSPITSSCHSFRVEGFCLYISYQRQRILYT